MQTLIKFGVLMLVLNIFTYLGVNFSMSIDQDNQLNKDYYFHFKGDLIETFMSGAPDLDQVAEDTKQNWTSYNVGFADGVTAIPEQQSGVLASAGVAFLDGLKIIWAFFATIMNIIQAPLTLFFNFRMPVFIGLMIGIPYFMILMLSFIALIRGAND